MKAKIKKIYAPRFSRNGDVEFRRLNLELEDGTFAMTDLVSSFRNFARWRPIILAGVGATIDGVGLMPAGPKGAKKVNADSPVRLYQEKLENTGRLQCEE